MAVLNIKTDETARLARELAAEMGTSLRLRPLRARAPSSTPVIMPSIQSALDAKT